MIPITNDLRILDDFLLDLDEDAMLLSELDGLLAGVVVCPEVIPPSQWMPLIWGEQGPDFKDEAEANTILNLIMGRYNKVAKALMRPDKYQPILEKDTDGTWLWEIWAEGFASVFALCPEGMWAPYEEASDMEVRVAMGFLTTLAGTAIANEKLPEAIDEEIRTRGDEMIAQSLYTLNYARMRAYPQNNNITATTNIGRNDPCPCGSGRKFKKCCLH